MSITQVLVEESINQLIFSTAIKVACDAIILLHQSLMRLLEIRAARTIRDHLLTLMHIVVSCLLKQWLLELLLIEFTRVFAHFNQHLNRGPNL